MISVDEARAIAVAFVNNADMRQCVARFAEVREHERYPNEYSVIFDLVTHDGSVVDSPFVIIVDKHTGTPRFR